MWLIDLQKHVGCEGSVVALLMFYSDQTSLSNNMRVSGYPVVMSIANISCEKRQSDDGHALLAIFPIIASNTGSYVHQFILIA